MGNRLDLQNLFEELLGSDQVYYDPPEAKKIEYPAIVYSKTDIWNNRANDTLYNKRTRYDLVVIDRRPDNPVIDKLLKVPYCSYDRHYTSDNLHHDSLTIYY